MENLTTSQYAPVVLFVYARPDHAEKTLNALAGNDLARDSDLIIFCDGPKKESAVEKNKQVIELITKEQSLGRFRSVTLNISEKNKGLAKSIITGVSEVMSKYGRCIVIEDDVVTNPYFLTYMNDCLDTFEKDKTIFSIAGFTYPLKALKNYPHDIYLSYRSCSQAWGCWIDRWETIDWEVKDFDKLKKSFKKRKQFNRGGNDLYRMLRHQMSGERDSWAIRFCYAQSKQNMYAIYPKETLTLNIGEDGSGTHCQDTGKKVDYSRLDGKRHVTLEEVPLNKKVLREFKNQYRITFPEAVDWLLRKIFKKKSKKK
ncbi:MAG: glycosyltransferase family 2 protein [Ruminococcaceae bacterium]|nr:glycosyltransferase family 2 protein [Oscillospiraceae bacterium]